jgi:hypothetical protein
MQTEGAGRPVSRRASLPNAGSVGSRRASLPNAGSIGSRRRPNPAIARAAHGWASIWRAMKSDSARNPSREVTFISVMATRPPLTITSLRAMRKDRPSVMSRTAAS